MSFCVLSSIGLSLFVTGLFVYYAVVLCLSLCHLCLYLHMSQEVQRCVFSMLSVVSTGIKTFSHVDP